MIECIQGDTWKERNQHVYRRNALVGLSEVLQYARPRKCRPLLEFAEAELRMPTGRFKGERFSRHYQPATAILLQEMDSDYWRQIVVVAGHQCGKSFSMVAWIMHTLFERCEDCILGLPDLNMRDTKWRKDIYPIISHSRFADQLPKRGAGSQGGVADIIVFQNGASLQFMGAGGGDTQRAGATCRRMAITEANAFDLRSGDTAESNKFEQIKGRVSHFAGTEQIVIESTVQDEDCLIWQEYKTGTASLVHCQCHCCNHYVAPEREHLTGWQDATTEEQARQNGRFSCPKCGIVWSEEQRLRNLASAVLVHSGQSLDQRGNISGPIPPTRKLGIRFSAALSAFSDAGSIAVEEWTAARIENAKKREEKNIAISQFRFAWPTKPNLFEVDPLDVRRLLLRVSEPSHGLVPVGTELLFGGVDIRKTQVHWSVLAFPPERGPHQVAWGVVPVNQRLELSAALMESIGDVRQQFETGFQVDGIGDYIPVRFTLVDAGWQTFTVQQACDLSPWMLPSKGFGSGILKGTKYKQPRNTGNHCRLIGQHYHVAHVSDRWLCEVDANRWKSRLHYLLRQDVGGMTFARTDDERHIRELVAHLVSETETERTVGGESETIFSEPKGANHWLDATYLALAAKHVDADLREFILADEAAKQKTIQQPQTITWNIDPNFRW